MANHRQLVQYSPSSVVTVITPLAPSPALNAQRSGTTTHKHLLTQDSGLPSNRQQYRRSLRDDEQVYQHQQQYVKPWGTTPKIECFGDYRQEAWIEQHVGGRLYEFQHALPTLPLPSVQDTIQRMLPTVLPLARNDDERRAFLRDVKTFRQQAQEAQEALEQRRQVYRRTQSSWLQHWWNTSTYLAARDPVVFNSSYFLSFADDTTVYATRDYKASIRQHDHLNRHPNDAQIKRAAAILFATAQVRQQIVTGTLSPDTVGRGDNQRPLCSTSYKYFFHACRVPGKEQDSYVIYDPALHHHAAVAVSGHLFAIPFVDPHNEHQPVALSVLEESLVWCVAQAQQSKGPDNELTWLTTQNRDLWAHHYNILSANADTRQSLRTLESAACLICLDDVSAYTLQDMAHVLLHGVAPKGDGIDRSNNRCNRWFDKSLQFVVTRNGKAGLLAEHSMMDGMPVAQVAEIIARTTYKDCCSKSQDVSSIQIRPSAVPIFRHDCVQVDLAIPIAQARQAHFEVVDRHEIQTKRFGVYGSDWIKQHAGMSPDAFVQMAMQIATYRLFDGEQGATYEATQVRSFLHGRTETTRSVSPESSALVQRFGMYPLWHETEDEGCCAEKLYLLRRAADAHTKYIRSAVQAYGVDRHLLGLRLAIANDGGDGMIVPDLFSNELFQRAKTWRVSTSNLSLPHFENWGYGEVTPNGVGLSYSILPQRINFSVTALREHHWVDRLCHHLSEALRELQMVVETGEKMGLERTAAFTAPARQ